MNAGRRLLPHAYYEWRGVAALLGVAVATVGLEALLPWPLKLIVDHVLKGDMLPHAASWLTALPGGGSAPGLLAWLGMGVFLLFVTSQALQLLKGVWQARVTARIQMRLARELFAKLQQLSLVYHRTARKGDLVRRVTTDTSCLSTLVINVALPLVTSALSLIVLFAIMWHLDAFLALVAASVALPMMVFMRLFAPRMAKRAYEHEEAASHVWSVAEQTLTALPVVQVFGREEHEKSRFSGVAGRSMQTYMRSLFTDIQFNLSISGCQAIGIGVVMVAGGIHVLQGSLSVGALIVVLSYVTALYGPLLAFAYFGSTSAGAMGSARRVVEVLDIADRIKDEPLASPLIAPQNTRGYVRLENVVFGYEEGKPVLHDVNFEASPGETVAIVGATGAGKTSLVSLIPRLFDPWSGRVLIDDQDVRCATVDSVRSAVAFVLQDPFLLPISIADNIAYGCPSADRSAIKTAARAANAHEFIEGLGAGYDSVIGERGATLSAGQRQRIAIARAVLKDAPILIMDEPTSALDTETEDAVLEALQRLMRGKTSIVIAHRLSTIKRADRIVVLHRGEIDESGSHQKLLAGNAIYRALYLGQLRHGRTANVFAA